MVAPDYSIQEVETVVESVIGGHIKHVDIARLTAPGENYLSLVFKVDFEVEKQDGTTESVSTVAKRLPLSDMPFEFNSHAMRNEIRFYREIAPLIRKLAEEFQLECDYFPRWLGGRLSLDADKTTADKESVLFLENLIPQGYKNEDRYVGFDLATTKAVLRTLAQFHGTVMAIKFKKPEQFQFIKKFLDECKPPPPPEGPDGHRGPPPGGPPREGGPHGPPGEPDPHSPPGEPGERKPPPGPPTDLLYDKILEDPQCQQYKEQIETMKKKPMGPENWHKEGPEPWNTISHGDFWVNNIMVKQRPDAEPLVKIVDFQVCTYSSFAKDLVFLLLSSVVNDVQLEYFDDLLRYYYDELTSIGKKLHIQDLDVTYDEYLQEVKRAASDSEVGHALFFSTVIFGQKNAPDVLTGEMNMFDHINNMINNMSDKQKRKIELIFKLSVERDWI